MAYATVEQFRARMDQVPASAETDDLIEEFLDHATDVLDLALGFSFSSEDGEKTVYGDGTGRLVLPPYIAGTVTAVESPSGTTLAASTYSEDGGDLLMVTAYGWGDYFDGDYYGGRWARNRPYVVTATWGFPEPTPAIVQACLEIAIRAWKGRDSGYSDVVGVAGEGEVAFNKAFTAEVKATIEHARKKYLRSGPGTIRTTFPALRPY